MISSQSVAQMLDTIHNWPLPMLAESRADSSHKLVLVVWRSDEFCCEDRNTFLPNVQIGLKKHLKI